MKWLQKILVYSNIRILQPNSKKMMHHRIYTGTRNWQVASRWM